LDISLSISSSSFVLFLIYRPSAFSAFSVGPPFQFIFPPSVPTRRYDTLFSHAPFKRHLAAFPFDSRPRVIFRDYVVQPSFLRGLRACRNSTLRFFFLLPGIKEPPSLYIRLFPHPIPLCCVSIRIERRLLENDPYLFAHCVRRVPQSRIFFP